MRSHPLLLPTLLQVLAHLLCASHPVGSWGHTQVRIFLASAQILVLCFSSRRTTGVSRCAQPRECARALQWSRALFHPSTSLCSLLVNTGSCRRHANISGFSQWVRLLGLALCSAQLNVAVRLKESKMGVVSEQFNPHPCFYICILTALLMLKHIY